MTSSTSRWTDTRLALQGAGVRITGTGSPSPVVQITGSVGKTTTKEMIAAVLGAKYRVLKTPENFNNDIGTPLTPAAAWSRSIEAAVIETGMNHFGEIRYLGEMVRPDIAVISNIGDAHIEFLGSREGILKAKSEIFENLKPDGTGRPQRGRRPAQHPGPALPDRPLRPVGALRRPGEGHC